MTSMSEQTISVEPDKLGIKSHLAIVAIAIGFIINPINGSLVITAYPHMAEVFDVPYAHMSALVMYFMAATAATQPLAGGIGDSIGRKKLFLIGIAGFTVASYLAAISITFSSLLIWRIAQAVFSGVILSNALGLVGQVVPSAMTGRYLGILNSFMVGATAVGFPLGGVLVEAFDWPMLFWLSVPLGIVAFLLAVFCIPKDEPRKTRFTSVSFIGLPFLPLAFLLQSFVQDTPMLPGMLMLTVTLAIVMLGVMKSKNSRAQFQAINNRSFNLSCGIAYFTSCIQFGIIFTLPAWTLVSLGINSGTLGLYLSAFSLTIFLLSPIVGKLLDRQGMGKIKWFGLGVFGIALSLLLSWLTLFSFALIVCSLGLAIAVSLLISQRTAMFATAGESQALGMGLFSSWRSVGGLSGNALAAIVMSSYPTVTKQAGLDVFQWQVMLFFLPLTLCYFFLNESKRIKQKSKY
ncbi:MFS transporter [Pseudomaricurvus sp.]|uniref:MFS transporter n=1 Tax=Pseudomaricurvus sp. TaxID=2004510 RepID=UPI003F6B5F82